MNRHTKLALFVVPFLLLGGYIVSDYYIEHQAEQEKVVQLVPFGHCDVINKKCVLKSGDFKVNVYDDEGQTTVNSTFPLDSATLFLVDSSGQASVYRLGMKDNPYYWQNKTPLRELISGKGEKYKLRMVLTIKGGQYISEFYTQTIK
ncbi:hypothetical protein AAD001_14060 [Colwelliaceae bacterium 6471]